MLSDTDIDGFIAMILMLSMVQISMGLLLCYSYCLMRTLGLLLRYSCNNPSDICIIRHVYLSKEVVNRLSSTNESFSLILPTLTVLLHIEALVNQRVTFTVTSSRISSIEVAIWLQTVTFFNQRVVFTDTCSRISSHKTLINQQVIFTDTSSRIKSMEVTI